MSLETGDIEEPKLVAEDASLDLNPPSTLEDLSDAEISSDLDLATAAEQEQKAKFVAEIISAYLAHSLIDERDAGNLSTLAAVSERLETGGTDEPKTEIAAEVSRADLILPDSDSLINSSDAENPSELATVTECSLSRFIEEETTKAEEHSDAGSSLTVPDSGNGEYEEPNMEFAAEGASIDLILPDSDSLMDSNDVVNSSDLAIVTECNASRSIEEETKAEEHSDVGSPLDTVTVPESLENGECEEPETDFVAEVTSADLSLPDSDSLINSNDTVNLLDLATVAEYSPPSFIEEETKAEEHSDVGSPLDTVTVLESPENGECEEPETDFVAEVTRAYLSILDSDSLINGSDALNPSESSTVTECNPSRFIEEETTKAEEHSDAGSPLTVPDSGNAESVDSEAEFMAEGTSIDLILPDSYPLIDSNDAANPSVLATLTECSASRFIEEGTKVEEEHSDVGSPLDTVTVPEHFENGECEDPETEFAAEGTSTDLILPGSYSLIDRSDTVNPSVLATVTECSASRFIEEETKSEEEHSDVGIPLDTVTVPECLENREFEEPKMEFLDEVTILSDTLIDSSDAVNPLDLATSADCHASLLTEEETEEEDYASVEELVLATGLGDGIEGSHLPREEGIQDGVDKVQDTPEDAFENNKSESESTFHNTAESGTREQEHHLDKAAITSTLEGETKYLSHSMQLPSELGKNVILLQCESNAPNAPDGVCLVNIIGTAHVSKASCEEVEALIRHVKPEMVFLELCSSRTNILLPKNREVPSFSSMLESYKKKEMNLFGLLYTWFLAKVGEKLEILPGTEFRVAYEEAVRCGASVTLGDRPIQATLKRTWGRMNIWTKAKFLSSVFFATLNMPSADEFHALMEKMEQSDELTIMIQELSKTFPTLLETVVLERDLYMVASLRAVARRYSSVVAVVGRGHLSGIANHWKEDINVEELMTVPQKNPSNRLRLWSTVALGIGGIFVGVRLMHRRYR